MRSPRQHQNEAKDEMVLTPIAESVKGIINLPTGSGKTFIQSCVIMDDVKKATTPHVYVVLSPRILLSNQLFQEIRIDMHANDVDCQYLIVHSGRTEDNQDLDWSEDMPYREIESTTSVTAIQESYQKALRENVPLVISGTYDSAERIIQAGIPVRMVHCDEAHYLVSEEFNWITGDQFPAQGKYFYTATLKETNSENGIGMNNTDLFGEILYQKLPIDMIRAGEMVRPRMHLVERSGKIEDEISADAHLIVEAFREHRSLVNVGAKMLVVTKGSEHLNNIVTHPEMVALRESRPNLTIFDITSAYAPRINGVVVSRQDFLRALQNMDDRDEAIIFHVKILTEGIDVPGITGVMPMNNLGLATFLQTLGRAARLYKNDRARLYAGEIKPEELKRFVKPYAWVIVPVSGDLGADIRDNIASIVYALRTYEFNPAEDVVIRASRGRVEPTQLEQLNEKDTRAARWLIDMEEIVHDVEEQEEADRLALEVAEINNMSEEEFWSDLLGDQ